MKKIIIFLIALFGFASIALAFQHNVSVTIVSEVVNSTTYSKNADGTVSKIEDVTRTTIIDPRTILQKITDINNEKVDLMSEKTLLDNAK